MPRKDWKNVSLSVKLIEEIDKELERDPVFKSRQSLIVHVMVNYLEKRKEKTPLSFKL